MLEVGTSTVTYESNPIISNRPFLSVVGSKFAPKYNIAIIDDDEASILYLSSYLRDKGYSVKTFQSPEKALHTIEAQHNSGDLATKQFDLFLLDYRMPKLDGLALTKKINNNFIKILFGWGRLAEKTSH